MVNHTKAFYIKQKEKEIQEKLRLEERRMLKESTYKRKLKRKREKYKAIKNTNDAEYQSYLEYQKEYQKIYREKCRLEKTKEREQREERLIAFLGQRNWKKIKFEGKKCSYYVVDDGHIYNESGKEIGWVASNGYVQTSIGGVHRLIWEAFKGEIPEGYEIDHINTIRNDNRLENLRLLTHKENCNNPLSIEHYKQHNKTVDRTYLVKYHTSLIKYYDIVQMDLENNIIAKYKTTKDLPSKYDKSSIYGVINGKYKTAYGYIWKAKYIKNIC